MVASGKPGVIGARLLDGVGWIRGPVANSYVLREGGHTYLLDAGFRDNASPVRLAFRRAGVPLSELTDILLTHQHPDHMGGAAILRWMTSAKVACHEMDTPAVEGRGPRLSPLLVRILFSKHPVQVDRVLKDGDRIGPFRAVGAPGHTLGSVAFYHEERKILFSGDAAVTSPRGVSLAAPFSNFDRDTAIDSLERLSTLEVTSLFAGHGRPIVANAGPLLKEAAKRAMKRPVHTWWTLAGPEGLAESHPRPEDIVPELVRAGDAPRSSS
ncbi:MAG: MBL fold metallo-hydrolase [Euryarchaeota archaeon]|nr:MBL fold metallo-hydrolase [Euryarchaeota archaeon]MDE1835763.1 MBL fold metallo-hydrolase [Euryarchaeota archaeon]MDE1881533.1 MBL fold metallo-hydrolase [Euryarchaeota archaeon]MDE2043954.1 MBL fold metallo-hydrolase [Thermoplasmata archaeon]